MVETSEKTFDDFYLSDEMLKALRTVGYKRPTPVQAETIPLTLAGIDLIVQSQTGSGKTAAFAIPTIEMLEPNPGVVEVLVLTPTRELANQVCKEFENLSQFKSFESTAIYGGSSYEKQFKALETAQIVCATPGRLLDLAKRGKADLSNLRMFCLDEADEMMSMGFREELNAIVEFLPEERQSLLFSATVTEDIKSLAKGMLYYPEYITLSGDQVAAEAVKHVYYRVTGVSRGRDLIKVLEYENPESALIFANTRDDTFEVTNFLKRHGYNVEVLNGELPQKQREKTLKALRDDKIDYIVATDVAARGIDISDLSHVFNYKLPKSAEVYIHRTGRTGRAGKQGRAVTLLSPAEMATHFDINTHYDIDIEHRELPTADEIVEAKQESRVRDASKRVMSLDRLPYGGKLGVARQFLEDVDEDNKEEFAGVLARLFTLADLALEDDAVLRRLTTRETGDVGGASVQSTPTPEAKSPAPEPKKQSSPDRDDTQKKEKAPEDDKRSKKKARSKSKSSKGGGNNGSRRRRSRGSTSSESSDSSGDKPRRRRRRSRNSDSEPKKETGSKQTREVSEDKSSTELDVSSRPSKAEFPTSKMYMNLGRDYFDGAEDLLEMICYMSGFAPEDFGDVTVQSSYSFIQVRETYFYDIINALNNQDWKGHNITAEPARK
ncbi:MAG: DEAD/DEAH box helicase [Myxococcota bacterium]